MKRAQKESLEKFLEQLRNGTATDEEALKPLGYGRRAYQSYNEMFVEFVHQIAVRRVAPPGQEFPADYPSVSRRRLLPAKVFQEFDNGKDCTVWLEELAQTFEKKCTWKDLNVLFLGGAIAVFLGRRDLLGRFGNFQKEMRNSSAPYALRSSSQNIYEKCFFAYGQILDGVFNDKVMRAMSAILTVDERFYYSSNSSTVTFSHGRIPGMCLCVFALAVLSGGDAKGLRKSYSSPALKDVFYELKHHQVPGVEREFSILLSLGEVLSLDEHEWKLREPAFAPKYTNGLSVFLSVCAQYLAARRTRGTSNIGLPPTSFSRTTAKHDYERDVRARFEGYLGVAREAIRAGQTVLGATLAGVLRHWDEKGAVEELLRTTDVDPTAALFIAERQQSRWQSALQELRQIALASDKAEEIGRQPFFWLLTLFPIKGEPDYFMVDGLQIWARNYLKSGQLSSGRLLTFQRSLSKDTSQFDVRPEDLGIISRLKSELDGDYYYSSDIPSGYLAKVLELFPGNPHVAVCIWDSKAKKDGPRKVVSLRGVPVSLETTTTDAGDLHICLPRLQRMAETVDSGYRDSDLRLIVKRVAGEEDVFEVPIMSPRMFAAMKIVWEQGVNGKLVIPASADEEAQTQLFEISQKIPMQGAFGEVGDTSNLPRETIDPMPHLRLSLETDDSLTISMRMLIDLGRKPILLEPGRGTDRLVLRKSGAPTVFERNLDGETAYLQEMNDFLKEQSGATPLSDTQWRIDNLEDALACLEALQGRPWPLDWIDATRTLSMVGLKSISMDAHHMGADQWFGLTGDFQFDDGKVLSFEQMLRALPNRAGRFIRLSGGQFAKISDHLRKKLDILNAAGKVRKGELEIPLAALPAIDDVFTSADRKATSREAADGEARLALPQLIVERSQQIRRELKRKVTLPTAFAGTLRPYQQEGFVWLSHLAGCRIGACLADDMGLGKTAEIIAVLLARAGDGASLVVAPTSVCFNWAREIRRFAPSLRPRILQGDADEAELASQAEDGDVVIVSYGLMVTRGEAFLARAWNGVVLDEAQAIKNDATKRFHAVTRLRSNFRIAATGTPVENRMGDFWSIFEFLNPGMLFSKEFFLSRYTADGRATPELKKLVSPLILRRLKKDVLKDLPPKTEINLEVELGSAERAAYEACRRTALQSVQNAAQSGNGGGGAGMVVLRELTRLRRFCCHPSLVYPEFLQSAKLDALAELLAELRANDHKALIFSQFVDYLDIVRSMIEKNGWGYQYLDGATSRVARGKAVDDFQSGKGDFFLISLKAGGFGLTLTAANYVILLDPWWNPAVENQAADRVHRIGQKQSVTVYRLVTKDTIEERVLALHAEKVQMAEDLLEGTGSASLTTADMIKLFR